LTDVQRAAAAARRRSQRGQTLAEIEAGQPTPEQFARNVYQTVQIKDPDQPSTRFAKRNLTSRNLERWRTAGKIDARQFDAGDRYRSDYEKSGFEQRVTSRYDGGGGGGDGTYSPAMPGTLVQMDAWKRWRAARADLGSLAAGFDAMAVHDQLAEEIDRGQDRVGIYTRRTSMMAVVICLDRLVIFYGL
jgi:hypothetical protein